MTTQLTSVTYIKKSTVSFPDLWNSFSMSRDSGGRWDATDNTPSWVKKYLTAYRAPSRAWPQSHSKAMLSQKFAKLLCIENPKLAVELGVAK